MGANTFMEKELDCAREIDNTNDPYIVSVMKGKEAVGYIPYT